LNVHQRCRGNRRGTRHVEEREAAVRGIPGVAVEIDEISLAGRGAEAVPRDKGASGRRNRGTNGRQRAALVDVGALDAAAHVKLSGVQRRRRPDPDITATERCRACVRVYWYYRLQ